MGVEAAPSAVGAAGDRRRRPRRPHGAVPARHEDGPPGVWRRPGRRRRSVLLNLFHELCVVIIPFVYKLASERGAAGLLLFSKELRKSGASLCS